MSQCVPNWDIDDTNHTLTPRRLSLRSHSNKSAAPDVPTLDYEVAELTWQNGQLAMHGLGPPRAPPKPHSPPSATSPSKYATWDKPRAAVNAGPAVAATGTLESLVNQATALPFHKRPLPDATAELIPWFNHAHASASATMTMDALVPCSDDRTATQFMDSVPGCGLGTCVVGCSKRVGSTSGGETTLPDEDVLVGKKRESGAVMAAAGEAVAPEWSGRDQSVSGSATFGRDSQQVTLDTCERDAGVGFTSTSPENTSSGKGYTKATAAADDSVSHSKPERDRNGEKAQKRNGKSSISTKRSRAAAIHNQSERKRRDKINQRMKTLQKLVPNSSKTDKASVLDEVIEYLKQLQAQVQVMNRMNMQPMMMPLALQQQLQMSMLSPMGMGMGMAGMGMPGIGMLDMNSLSRPTMAGIPPVLHPAANPFVQMGSWDAERIPLTTPAAMADPVSAFLACQSQPMTLDSYSRLAAMYQQMHQQQPSTSKN